MKLLEKIRQHRENERIKCIKRLLYNEYDLPYTTPLTVTEKLFASSQPYAKIMYDCIDYYVDKENDIINIIREIISEYGTHAYRYSSSVKLEKEVIQLNLPDVIKSKLDTLNTKLESDRQKDLNTLVTKLDESIREL